MSLRKDKTRACGYIRFEFTHWALWRTLMRTECFFFVHHTASILAKLSTWCFYQSGEISCSLLVNPSHTDESWEGWNTCLWIYTNIYICIYIYRYRYRYIYLKILHIGYKRSSQVSLFPGKEEYLKSAKVPMENGIFQTQF